MKRKGLTVIMLLILIPLLIYISINVYACLSAKGKLFSLKDEGTAKLSADAILVLGAGVRPDGTPSNMLEDRLLTALDLYEKGICKTILVSGDHGSKFYDEVNVMKDYLVEKGIPSESIFMDHAGFSTYDSLYRAKAIFGAESLVIVTQEYHSFRSLMIGESLGIECRAVSAPILSSDVRVYPKQAWYSFRESLARVKDFAYCLWKPQPSVLGDKISLQGSGDVTNDGESAG